MEGAMIQHVACSWWWWWWWWHHACTQHHVGLCPHNTTRHCTVPHFLAYIHPHSVCSESPENKWIKFGVNLTPVLTSDLTPNYVTMTIAREHRLFMSKTKSNRNKSVYQQFWDVFLIERTVANTPFYSM